MKKALYCILLFAASLFCLLSLGLISSWMQRSFFLVLPFYAALLAWAVLRLVRLKRAGSNVRKARRLLLLALLLPTVLALIVIAYIVISLILYI